MLQSLYVKNLALIEETRVDFTKGLNILTGETGAGKSLIIGSVNLALGGKFDASSLRHGAESGLVELTFDGNDKRIREKMEEMELPVEEDGSVLISRRLQAGKTLCRINGESVSARQVKELAEVLIDIHGQHEHQSLLNKKKHMEILDSYCGEKGLKAKEKVAELYKAYREILDKISKEEMDDAGKEKERALAEFELEEISNANIVIGEDEELEKRYRIMSNSKRINDNVSECMYLISDESETGAGGSVTRALRALSQVADLDEKLKDHESALMDVEGILSDLYRELDSYIDDNTFDEETFRECEERLDLLNRLKNKYGKTLEDVVKYAEKKQEFLDKISDYDAYMSRLFAARDAAEENLKEACEELSDIRKEEAVVLSNKITEAMVGLNFNHVDFEIRTDRNENITSEGFDDIEFMLSTNPGESVKPLKDVASGGELSRTMLAIKTVLAKQDFIDTLIFDEIDSGISGKTAWKVSEQLNVLSRSHQILCITHLPQIAAMADSHYLIEKSSSKDNTITDIEEIRGEDSERELARLLGSDSLTEAALENAREMKKQALDFKTNKN
ncbi:MAG: DNA repair protein RecN [Acetatifactor sp.]|nr:DNA repair protein RecN [Acetatifactor sp.]